MSLAPKIDELRVHADLISTDLVMITETWLRDSISDQIINIPSYCVVIGKTAPNQFMEASVFTWKKTSNSPFKPANLWRFWRFVVKDQTKPSTAWHFVNCCRDCLPSSQCRQQSYAWVPCQLTSHIRILVSQLRFSYWRRFQQSSNFHLDAPIPSKTTC